MKPNTLKVGDVIMFTAYGAPMLVLESKPELQTLMYLRLFNLETGQFESHGVSADLNSSWLLLHKAAK